jgi:hypothetical protein
MRQTILALVVAGVFLAVAPERASAQVIVTPAPVVSLYTPPVVSYQVPVVVNSPVVSYYVPAAPIVSWYSPVPAVNVVPAVPTVAAVPVVYPATIRRGLFGRTIVETPFYRLKY